MRFNNFGNLRELETDELRNNRCYFLSSRILEDIRKWLEADDKQYEEEGLFADKEEKE